MKKKIIIDLIIIILICSLYINTFSPVLNKKYNLSSNADRIFFSIMPLDKLMYDSLIRNSIDTDHPPFIHLITKFQIWINNGNINEKTTLMPFFVAGLLSIISLYWITSKIWGRLQGVVAAFLLLTSQHLLNYISSIEDMPFFIFFSIWLFYSFYEFIIKDNKKYKTLFIITNILLMWTYYAAVFIYLSETLYILLFNRKWLLKFKNLKTIFIIFIFTSPVLFTFSKSLFMDGLSKLTKQHIIHPETFMGYMNNNLILYLFSNLLIEKIHVLLFVLGIIYLIFNLNKNINKFILTTTLPFILFLPFINDHFKIKGFYFFAFFWIYYIIMTLSLKLTKDIMKRNITKNKTVQNIMMILFAFFIIFNIIFPNSLLSEGLYQRKELKGGKDITKISDFLKKQYNKKNEIFLGIEPRWNDFVISYHFFKDNPADYYNMMQSCNNNAFFLNNTFHRCSYKNITIIEDKNSDKKNFRKNKTAEVFSDIQKIRNFYFLKEMQDYELINTEIYLNNSCELINLHYTSNKYRLYYCKKTL